MEQNGTCSLCGVEYDDFGHNPDPLGDHDWRVCGDCNDAFVIPARLSRYTERQMRVLQRAVYDGADA